MPTFHYKVRDKYGNPQTGVVEASTEEAAAEVLSREGFVLTNLTPEEKINSFEKILRRYSAVSLKQLMVYTKQLAVMINAGMPIVESLETLAEEETSVKFARIIADVAKQIEGGTSFSDAIAKYPDVFSGIYINMVKSGETSGKLDTVLLKIADQLEKDHDLRTKVKGAMIYPAFILVSLSTVGLLLFTFVIPRLRPVLESAGVKLPFLTKAFIFISESILKFWWLMIPALFLGFILARYYFRTPRGGEIWASVKPKIPIYGLIVKKMYIARFNRTFATLVSGGVHILDALEITSDAIGNIHYKRDVLTVAKKVKNGVSLADAFKDSEKFPKIVRQMIKVGESTGTLDSTVSKLADFYEADVDNIVNNLSRLLEPVLIIIMGIGVALVVSSVIMPLYDITKAVK